ncbi:MAG: FGGY family carbohydrate kinase, partial [Treponemataceae bacterium]
MSKYFMGIDNGGTLCKAVIFDEHGAEVAGASRKLRMITPRAGFTERDMEELWTENAAAIREAITKSGVRASDIAGVACSGHGKGLYLWGKDGAPCYNGVVSTDSRAWAYPEKWNADGTADRVFKKTFQR